MLSLRSNYHDRNRRAVALVIVLAFVVLVTGVIIAFFSRALVDRQISNSSANAIKAGLFAQGAIDTIASDLKQEIAAGSNATLYTDSSQNGKVVGSVYLPANANAIVPARTLGTVAGVTSFAPNLIKRSAYNQPFFPSSGADYNSGNTAQTISLPQAGATPAPVSAPVHAPSNRAANVASTRPSQNGRFFSLARWNKHLLLPKQNQAPTNDTDLTPVSSGANAFAAPDWVLVARDGTNPQAASASVVGRYAYAIYDEGGLLDANVAGYPLGAAGSPALYTSANSDTKSAYKNAAAFADLSQLPGFSALSANRQQSVINSLVGWRNFASSQLGTGSLANGFAFDLTARANFTNSILGNTTGFLKTANLAMAGGQTDRLFASRQELINLLLQGIAPAGSAGQSDRANLQNALQYLGTFSRDVSQPSFAPNPSRPKIVTLATGGNDMVGKDTDVAASNVNPSFLQARVSNGPALLRNDGTTAAVGEPIVKKRFALNRLAWLTYRGVSASRNIASPVSTATGPDYDLYLLENNYNVSQTLLQQGNAANVYRYFGLSWVSDSRSSGSNGAGDGQMKWVYSHIKPNPAATQTASPVTTLSGVSPAAIYNLSQVAAAGREPDFVELLKAAICAGSLGKAGTAADPAHPGTPGDHQNGEDVSVDAAVIQIAANIIDQFDTDGIATRILFDDGGYSAPQEYRGVEDLPYFYRLRGGYFPVRTCAPAIYDEPYKTTPGGLTPVVPPDSGGPVKQGGYIHPYNAATFTDPGLAVAFQEPEIWNPHSPNSAAVVGPRPTQFRLTASDVPPTYATPPGTDAGLTLQAAVRYVSNLDPTSPSHDYSYCPVSTAPQHAVSLTPDSSALVFTIPSNRLDLFREPTLLIKPGVPTGSQLQFGPAHQINSSAESAVASYYLQDPVTGMRGLKSTISGPVTGTGAADNNLYIGIYLGCFPLYWHDASYVYTTNYVKVSGVAQDTITYRMQYQDPVTPANWVTYDEKYTGIVYDAGRNNNTTKGVGNAMSGDDNMVTTYLDPRSSRFGMIKNLAAYNTAAAALWPMVARNLTNGYNTNQAGWAGSPTGGYNSSYQYAAMQNALWTARPDDNSGFTSNLPSVPGWNLGSGTFRPGMLTQNNPAAAQSSARFAPGNGNGGEPVAGGPCYFSDPDGVVRRGMSAYLPPLASGTSLAPASPAGAASGQPMKVANTFAAAGSVTGGGNSTPIAAEAPSRPIILNRPFRTVAELGYVFSGTPWRNLDFSTPESGSVALLDVFSTNDTDEPTGMVAGKVNLNTRQVPVLQALLSGAVKDEFNPSVSIAGSPGAVSANTIAQALIARTTSTATGLGPVTNMAGLVGNWRSSVSASPAGIDGSQSYQGFSGVPAAANYTPPVPATDLSAVLEADTTAGGYTMAKAVRYREAVVRALSNIGTTRVWNLMIDVVAQTGRYPVNTTDPGNFSVEGEQRYWVHLAIDRLTGRVIDKQIEVVKE